MARPRRCRAPERGPKRKRGSQLKIPCALKACGDRRNVDCKNKPWKARVELLNPEKLRPLRPQATVARFCCAQHRDAALGPAPERGGREALTAEQAVWLFNVLRQIAPWAAVLFLITIMVGERAAAMCQASARWLRGMDPASSCVASIVIPRVNKKTTPRTVALPREFADLLWCWCNGNPLQGGSPESPQQWPHRGQAPLFADRARTRFTKKALDARLLFPGRVIGGHNRRQWCKPITTRGFFGVFQACQEVLRKQRHEARSLGRNHPFEGVSLKKVTTHTCKKTAATLLSEKTSVAVMSAITGTSSKMLLTTYVRPTADFQRNAMSAAYQPLLAGINQRSVDAEPRTENCVRGLVHCTGCGLKQGSSDWKHCPGCGRHFITDLLRNTP
ncbi:unnamed protein product [Symbiodinium sp. CCMP2592]|nr:unnamed protein product [Symbiodinium sp. CCMP2592]